MAKELLASFILLEAEAEVEEGEFVRFPLWMARSVWIAGSSLPLGR